MKKMNFIMTVMVAAFIIGISSCSSYTPLITDVWEIAVEDNEKNYFPMYLDREVVIEREVTKSERKSLRESKGTFTTRNGKDYYAITFKEKLNGQARVQSTEERLEVLFDDGDNDFLVFKNSLKDDYYHLVGRIANGTLWVTYGNIDYQVTKGESAKLLIKRAHKAKEKKNERKAKGRDIKY